MEVGNAGHTGQAVRVEALHRDHGPEGALQRGEGGLPRSVLTGRRNPSSREQQGQHLVRRQGRRHRSAVLPRADEEVRSDPEELRCLTCLLCHQP